MGRQGALPGTGAAKREDDRKGVIAVIGAGIVGSAVAYALTREGRKVLLIDRTEPGCGGASYGNAGHIASELVQPLPSIPLLFNFWRELTPFGGPLAIPPRRWLAMLPWMARFAAAAFHRRANTQPLASLVKPSTLVLERWLREVRASNLLKRHGHYEVWHGSRAPEHAALALEATRELGVRTELAPWDILRPIKHAARASDIAGVWFADTAHVLDPLDVGRAFAAAAISRGAAFKPAHVTALRPLGDAIEIVTSDSTTRVVAAVVCAGAWSAPLLGPFGLRVPLEAAHGYHVELHDHAPLVDAPLLYVNDRVLVTPMTRRLRATGFMEFSGLSSSPDPSKPAHLRHRLRALGYRAHTEGPSWRGPRPVLPDYLPAIGRVPGAPRLFYAIGHQHIGLTLAPITAELIADLVANREPRHDVAPFDLRRFDTPFFPSRMAHATEQHRVNT